MKANEKRITAYKGFDENLCCRGFQYEVGKEYEHDGEGECCSSGFHACTNPFDVLDYYSAEMFINNRFCEVEQYGVISREEGDTKQASSRIKIKKEISIKELFSSAIYLLTKEKDQYIEEPKITNERGEVSLNQIDNYITPCNEYDKFRSSGKTLKITSSVEGANIASIGYYNQIQIASSGDYTKIGSICDDDYICSSGHRTKIGSEGNCAHIASSGGDDFICSFGGYAQIASSGEGANIYSYGENAHIGSSGDYNKIASSGECAQIATSGDEAHIDSTGEDSVICCTGGESSAKAKKGSWITLSEWGYSKDKKRWIPVCVKTEFVDGERIKEDTWYKLENGEFVERTV